MGLLIDLQHLGSRAGSLANQLHAGYGRDRLPLAFRYISEFEFNAYAGKEAGGYTLELNVAVPLFSIILFHRLLSEDTVLPHLETSGHIASDFALPAIIDPANFDRRADWKVSANGIRAFAAGTIADFCSTFVLCHEFGHILSGHVEGMRHYYGSDKLPELVSRERAAAAAAELRQAWEFEADRFAAALLIQFVEELADNSVGEPRTKLVFSEPRGFHFEHTLASCVAALFAFFVYVQGMRTRLDRFSSHPHPYVRATYLKHALVQVARERRDIDLSVFSRLMDARLDEMLLALERIELLDTRTYTKGYMKRVNVELDRLDALARTHRDSCAQWRWID